MLGLQDALALHLGGVGREHGRDIGTGQRLRNLIRRNACPAQTRQRHLNAAFLRIACTLVHCTAANVVAVFGQIGQVREIGKGADHAHRLVGAQVLEQLFQRLVSRMVVIAAKRYGQLAHLLDQCKYGLAFLLTDDVSQNAAQQPDIFQQR